MRYSLNLLKKYITVQDTVENIAQQLTLKTCEIEEIVKRELPAEVVIGKVLETKQHPDADKLTICQVDCGAKGKWQICTGGENIKAGVYVPTAIPGCYLPAIDLKIEPRKLRGEDSNGMICSKGELGIVEDEDKHRIWIMNEDLHDLSDADIGTPLGDKYPRMNNAVLDVDNKTITHRPDLTGHFGLAREVQAIYALQENIKTTFTKLSHWQHTLDTTNMLDTLENATKGTLQIEVDTPECQSYIAVQYNNVSVKPSSLYTRLAVQDIGQNARNNRIDFSNLFMLTTGQPIHIFDADSIKGKLTVRKAKKGEKFVDLKDGEHVLTADDIVIADKEKVLALAGVIGGKSSAVTDETKNIVVEIAHFDPVAVRKTGTRLGLRTDAELRFEKSISPLFSLYAFIFFLEELEFYKADLGDFTLGGVSYQIGDQLKKQLSQPKIINIDEAKGKSMIFPESSNEFSDIGSKILTSLGFLYDAGKTTVPLRRSPDDMNIAADIYEEVARIYGYENVQARPLPGNEMRYVGYSPEVKLQRLVEDYLIREAHMDQVETYPRADEKSYNQFRNIDTNNLLTLLNPTAPELSKLRPDMLYGMMELIEKNHRSFDEINCFDTGKIRPAVKGDHMELKALSIISYKKSINNRQDDTILTMKSHIRNLLAKIGVTDISFVETSHSFFHPKKQAEIKVGDQVIGCIATIHPLVQQKYKIPESAQVTTASLSMDWMQQHINKTVDTSIKYTTLQDQIVSRDLCFVIDSDKSRSTVLEPLKKIQNISDIAIFDLYSGNKLPEGKKSIAFSFSLKGD